MNCRGFNIQLNIILDELPVKINVYLYVKLG
jgi:hypothetical protein